MNLDSLFYPSRMLVEKENRLILLDKQLPTAGTFRVDLNIKNSDQYDQFKIIYDSFSINTSTSYNIFMNLNNDYGATQYEGYYMRGTASTVTAAAMATDKIIAGFAANDTLTSGEITISNQKNVWKTVLVTFGNSELVQTGQANWKNTTDRVNKISIYFANYPFLTGAVFKLYGLR